MEIESLEDFPTLRQLARALWRTDSEGRGAAVLVGAGFSRNADLAAADSRPPPLWTDLARSMVDQLYKGRAKDAPSDSLRLAEEFRAYLGQSALTEHLREHITDDAWFPSKLHKDLLAFPWADVLTTNYDTLLERAARDVTVHNYQVVKTTSDLIRARAPRIIKLHGTIGDQTPLVIAEDDYRTYPSEKAAFVNVARQIFIENELCLLGFSGVDPNFLAWSGWVRDALGGGHRRIFLVGVLRLPPAARRLLETRNVAPIDLAPLVDGLEGHLQHARANSILFEYLQAARPLPKHVWKFAERTSNSKKPGSSPPDVRAQLSEMVKTWQQERMAYPGWLVCHHMSRIDLRTRTYDGLAHVFKCRAELSTEERDAAVFELAWRYEISFWPIPPELKELMECASQSPAKYLSNANRAFLAVCLARLAREEDDDGQFEKWISFAERLPSDQSIAASIVYERCLHARNHLDFERIESLVDQVVGNDPVWKLRSCFLHAILQQWDKVHSLVAQALAELRLRERADPESLWLRSRRAWAQYFTVSNFRDRGDEGFHSLSPSEIASRDRKTCCDAWSELDHLRESVSVRLLKNQEAVLTSIQPLFTAGSYRDKRRTEIFTSHTVSSAQYEVKRLREVVGLADRIENMTMLPMSADAVILEPRPTISWHIELVHAICNDKDKLDRHLSRLAVARASEEVRSALFERVFRAVTYWRSRVERTQIGEGEWNDAIQTLRSYLQVLYRLAPTLDLDRARQCFDLAIQLGSLPAHRHWWLFDAIRELARHSAGAIPHSSHLELVLQAIEYPLSTEASFEKGAARWPEPFEFLNPSIDAFSQKRPRAARVSELLRAVASGDGARHDAALRLHILHKCDVLSSIEIEAFGAALWLITDEHAAPLPTQTHFLKHMFVELPAPSNVDAAARVRSRLFDFPADLAQETTHLSELQNAALRTSDPIFPNESMAEDLFERLAQPVLPRKDADRFAFGRYVNVPLLTGAVISLASVPQMSESMRTEDRASRLLELTESGDLWAAIPALVFFMHLSDDIKLRIVERIRAGVLGASAEEVMASASAIEHWATNPPPGSDPATAAGLIDALINAAETGRERGAIPVLSSILKLLKHGVLSQSQVDRTARALVAISATTEYTKVEPTSEQAVSVSILRAACVRLAATLLTVYNGKHLKGLRGLVESSKTDPLPEVRFATLQL